MNSKRASKPPPTVTLGRITYTVAGPFPGVTTYTLTGPRGGKIDGIRNVHSKKIHLVVGARTLPYIGSDESGELVIVAI